MSLFKKLFSAKEKDSPPAQKSDAVDPRNDPNMIRVFDGYGRELFITRQTWLNSLKDTLKKAWDQPDQLYGLILQSVQDGFFNEMIQPAEQLRKIDPLGERSAVMLGIVYMKTGQLDRAEKILMDEIQLHGESGIVLTNLAKVYSERGDQTLVESTLWHALELDPNQDNGMGWYELTHRERGGEQAGLEALRRVAQLPKSWRARIWLARDALKNQDLPAALTLYHEALEMAGDPVPSDFLMQMSSDLGKNGHLPELLELTTPHFDVLRHGLQVGNNLIKAHLDLGQVDEARKILDQLYAQKRPDWSETLAYWDVELAKTSQNLGPVKTSAPVQVVMLAIQNPIWLRDSSPAAELFPAKVGDAPVICFLGSSAEMPTTDKTIRLQSPDTAGRLSRSLPLFLAEQTHFRCTSMAQTMIPWVTSPTGGFLFSGKIWKDDGAATSARQCQPPGDYIVIVHLRTVDPTWQMSFRLVRTIDNACLGSGEASFDPTQPEKAAFTLTDQLFEQLSAHAEVTSQKASPFYQVPTGVSFADYLLRLEQSLAVSCSSMEGVAPGFLSREREIIEGNIRLCLDHPQNPTTRILLAQTLRNLQKVRPNIVLEYREKVELLQREKPLTEPAAGVVHRIFEAVFVRKN